MPLYYDELSAKLYFIRSMNDNKKIIIERDSTYEIICEANQRIHLEMGNDNPSIWIRGYKSIRIIYIAL